MYLVGSIHTENLPFSMHDIIELPAIDCSKCAISLNYIQVLSPYALAPTSIGVHKCQ